MGGGNELKPDTKYATFVENKWRLSNYKFWIISPLRWKSFSGNELDKPTQRQTKVQSCFIVTSSFGPITSMLIFYRTMSGFILLQLAFHASNLNTFKVCEILKIWLWSLPPKTLVYNSTPNQHLFHWGFRNWELNHWTIIEITFIPL